MKRCIVVSVKNSVDKETNENLLFIDMYQLASLTKSGNLFYPKKSDALITTCINQTKRPMDFSVFEDVRPGALVDITYGVNEYTNKSFVARIDLVPNTNHFTDSDLYL